MHKAEDTGKRWIRPLPERLVNKIAAGEVIERPASVLKELMENSFDAHATRIEIIVEKSGTKRITIVDNGWGIPADQVEIAFSRHATSKISDFSDLDSLLSFGFRGEALPSIASVSKTRMITRTADSEAGTEIVVEGGVLQSVKPVAAPVGTKVEVADLFFNTPARRKFLKSEVTEARHLSRNAMALALSGAETAISCRMNERLLFSLDKTVTDLKKRVGSLLLGGQSEDVFEVLSDTEFLNIRAYLSSPRQCRQNRNGLYFFINNRFIYSPTLLHAVTAGYGEMLPKGNFPVGAVVLEVDPVRVDVNVHPTKAEVRLSDERAVHDLLYQAIKRSVRGTTRIPSAGVIADKQQTLSTREAIKKAKNFKPFRDYSSVQADLKILYGENHQDADSVSQLETGAPPSGIAEQVPLPPNEKIIKEESPSTEADGVDYDRLKFVGQFSELYLLFLSGRQLLIIDQHTAHERILYEENLKSIETGAAVSQSLLFPIDIDLSPDRFSLFEEALEILKASGFDAEPFGAAAVLLNAVPTSLSKKSPEKVFNEILDDVENLKEAGLDLKKAVAQSIACRAAIMAGDRVSDEEAISLLKRLLKADNHYCCPHGRPTILKISREELDAKFGRK